MTRSVPPNPGTSPWSKDNTELGSRQLYQRQIQVMERSQGVRRLLIAFRRNTIWHMIVKVHVHIREGKSPDDKKTPHFLLNFLQISTIFASFSQAHAGTLQNHSISPCTTTVRNNTVESSTIFHSNLMLRINWFNEI
jgi:hypothetical protein